ncbi:MAG: poly-beta-1,6 N-acetyl-D-glucosamine export porin PgaA [Castellaniella sp.]|uniref:poly-beta-1,6 N-acetyl-D-glucosamine export porin PgaA n=1 Tax=Castellaniella sp. TaxID=1955812 RepID=UPI003A8C0042
MLRQRLRQAPDDRRALEDYVIISGWAGQPYAALEQASGAYERSPQAPRVAHTYILALRQARLPQDALRIAQAHPGVAEPALIRTLQADVAAQLTRAASFDSRGEADRYILADQALNLYDQLIPQWQALGPEAHDVTRRAEADRLQALRARDRMQDIEAGYAAMLADGTPVPDYALRDAASAYLTLNHPDTAVPLFEKSLNSAAAGQDTEDRTSDEIGLYYAQFESNHADAANARLDRLLAASPTWLYYKGNPDRYPNPQRLDAELARPLGLLYQGDTWQAQSILDHMVNEAPNNTNLRVARAQAYRIRELPRQSELDLKIAETQAPRATKVEVGQAETAIALQEWKQARLLHDDLMTRMPEDQGVQRMHREWVAHEKAEWRTTSGGGTSTGGPLGSHDLSIDTVLYSPPIGENWRTFAGVGHAQAKFEEGHGYYTWARAGVEWRSRDLTAQIEATGNRYGHGTRAGGAFSLFVDLDDHWQIGVGGARLTRDAPLRALKHNITANRMNASIRWRGDERREWVLTVTPSFFSDGNNRIEASLTGRQRLYTTPRFQIDALLDLATSHNTADDAPYFNPKSDVTILPTLQMTHTLYQRNETRWEQQFLLAAGTYHQRGYGTDGIYSIGYGQRYRLGRTFDIGVLATGTSRPYDGERERSFNVFVDMTYRF